MPVINRIGDLLTDDKVNVICHQANIFHTFGSGIARAIKDLYPEAYEADCETKKGSTIKLGSYSYAKTDCGRHVVNCYSQTGMGASDRNTSYNDIIEIFTILEKNARAWNNGLKTISDEREPMVIGVPYKYGCGLAGGRWRVVNAIFEDIFKNSSVELHIIRLASEPEVQF